MSDDDDFVSSEPRPSEPPGFPGQGRQINTRVVTPIVALVVVILALGFTLMPFKAVAGVSCSAPLRGAKPTGEVSSGAVLGGAEAACQDAGNSRKAMAATVSAIFIGAALVAVFHPTRAPRSRMIVASEGQA